MSEFRHPETGEVMIPRTPVDCLLSDLRALFSYPPAPYLTEDAFEQRVAEFKQEITA